MSGGGIYVNYSTSQEPAEEKDIGDMTEMAAEPEGHDDCREFLKRCSRCAVVTPPAIMEIARAATSNSQG
jgi:hypothetical protein